MGIESPETYGDWYWKNSVEATKFSAAEEEIELAAMAGRLMSRLNVHKVLPDEFTDLFNEIQAPAGDFMGGVGGRFVSEVADGAVSKAASPFFQSMGYLANQLAPTTKMTPAATATLYARNLISESFFLERFRMGGFEPHEAWFQYQSQLPYPSIPDIALYARYHGDPYSIASIVNEYFDVSGKEFRIWEWMGLQRLNTMQVQTAYRRGLISEGLLGTHLAQIGWSAGDATLVRELGWSIPNAMLLVQGDLMQQRSNTEILKDISFADINPIYAQQYLDAILTKPSSQDIIAYELRKDPTLSKLGKELRRIGIHEEYFPVYKELALQIPPVADIITMAVREAFTPAIAAKFGQYQDFPRPLEEWGLKKGLSAEWTKRYWAAHWSLPSPLQGFEMLHRGVINKGELDMLLRALDVMPFWRAKLTGIAYRRVTRVDIRRMYKAGVISISDVYDSYIELGYTDRDAKRMTDFTVQWALPKEASITRSDILTAYKTRMITRPEAAGLLEDMGEEYFHREFMLKAVDYKKQLEITELQIKGITNLYKRRAYDENTTRAELLKLDLPSDEVDLLMREAYYELKAETPRRWTTAQVLSFIKDGLITRERGELELQNIGYDAEHIDVYMRTIE